MNKSWFPVSQSVWLIVTKYTCNYMYVLHVTVLQKPKQQLDLLHTAGGFFPVTEAANSVRLCHNLTH